MSDERKDPPQTGQPLRTEAGFTPNTNRSNKSQKDNKKPKP
jgi:hypothetical protein